MHSRMQRLGVALRPHLKTAKSADIARLVTQGQAGGVTVSTLAEAEYFRAQWVQGHSVCCRHSAGQTRKGRCIGKVGGRHKTRLGQLGHDKSNLGAFAR